MEQTRSEKDVLLSQESLSLQLLKKYVSHKSEEVRKSIELFEDLNFSPEDVARGWSCEAPPQQLVLAAPFNRFPESIHLYRHIISQEEKGFHSYHGYDALSAGLYDIYTTIGEELNNHKEECRSRFRYNFDVEPFKSADEFLGKTYFFDDHDPSFTKHGISAVPHVFSNTAYPAENCLSGLRAVYVQTLPQTLDILIKDLGFKDAQKYLDLINCHLKGGFITRFSFTQQALDLATYPAPNAVGTRKYGLPWHIGKFIRVSSSYLYQQLENFEYVEEENQKSFLFNMQFRNIFIPSVYNDSTKVTTKIFSSHDLGNLSEYYTTLRGYVKEDLLSLGADQQEQVSKWLK